MHVVAIHGLTEDVASNAAHLAAALGITAYEARARVQVQGGGPAVVGTRPDDAGAEALAAPLREAGFTVLVLDAAAAAGVSAFEVRTFSLETGALVAATRGGDERQIPWSSVDLLVRGTSAVRETSRKKVKERTLSVGRAVATGGLMLHKTREKEQVSTSTRSEAFMVVRSVSGDLLSFRESILDYKSLGTAMQPSRAANFMHLVSELRGRAPGATYDDRLMRRAAQQQMLGPSLDADEYLDLAVALVVRTS